jgi:ubiquinone/menaquinone biosynthesis C-methylase UbiE
MSNPTSIPIGNYYDKFNSRNPVTRVLMQGFKNNFLELLAKVPAQTILEIGCGEGHMLELMHQNSDARLFGFDIDIPILIEANRRCPTAHLSLTDAQAISYASNSVDLVVACEVLEHVEDPEQVIAEARRVTRRYAIYSVPREPIWRILNIARGKYLGDSGNTPGHIQHWNTSGFVDLLQQQFRIIDVRRPLPWTMVLCEVLS